MQSVCADDPLYLSLLYETETNAHIILIKGASHNSCRCTNPNNIRIWVGGWVLGYQVFGFPGKKKICTPRNTVFVHDFLKDTCYVHCIRQKTAKSATSGHSGLQFS